MSVEVGILSLNTHLFGGHWFLPKWNDTERAIEIGEWLRENRPDIVALQEVWDRGLFRKAIVKHSEYPSWAYGARKDLIGLNSGLAILGMIEGQEFEQGEFVSESGMEAFATKGWLKATLVKDPLIPITVFNSHTQSDDDHTREEQLKQLAFEVRRFREQNPNHVVFVVGDLNVEADSLEYRTVLKPLFEDADEVEFDSDTYSLANPLVRFFDSDATNSRLDYIFFYSNERFKVEVIDKKVVRIRGKLKEGQGLDSSDVSDHFGVFSKFRLKERKQ